MKKACNCIVERKNKEEKKASPGPERERESTYTSHAVKTTKVTIGEQKEDKNMRKQLYQNTTETVTRIFIRMCVYNILINMLFI